MKTQPIVGVPPACDADGVAGSGLLYRDRRDAAGGALAQARHVFLRGNGLPERWRGRRRFTVLETGFGLGHNFLAAWDAWRADPARSDRLDFLSVEKHPSTRDALAALHASSALAAPARELVAAWPPLTHNLHTLRFDGGRVRLLLALGDVADWLPEIVARVDAFFLDGFAPDLDPAMWTPRVCKALARLAAPGATAATWIAARVLREAMQAAGFEVRVAAGTGGKRDITLATWAPRFTPRRAPPRLAEPDDVGSRGGRHALIIGAGLAGCASAWALAEQGWTSRVYDAHATLAAAASGNAGALFHGAVHPGDGPHARFNRAAALRATGAVRLAHEAFGVAAGLRGLLRLETDRGHAAMQALLDALGLPSDCVQALDADAASRAAGLPLGAPAWFYPGGGWVDPRALAAAYLHQAGAATRFESGVAVGALRRADAGRPVDAPLWQLVGVDGRVIDTAPVVVLANGHAARRLAGRAADSWRLSAVRGQATLLPAATPGLRLPALPLAGAGYVLPALPGGWALCGAGSDRDDESLIARPQDDLRNLERLVGLTGSRPEIAAGALRGRAGVRCVAVDRLPLIGGLPLGEASQASLRRVEQPRFVPRTPGLYAFTALASRGVVWSALGAEILAAIVSGGPCPVEAGLLDAVDAARFAARAARRS